MAVIVIPEKEPIKACKCNAPIIAEATATVKVQSAATGK